MRQRQNVSPCPVKAMASVSLFWRRMLRSCGQTDITLRFTQMRGGCFAHGPLHRQQRDCCPQDLYKSTAAIW